MCTASWSFSKGGYRLLFNRDERKTRQRAYPPKTYEREGVRILAPVDPPKGGTWIAANEFGLSAAVFNFYGAFEKAPLVKDPLSRGLIPFHLSAAKNLDAAEARFRELELERFPPFVLLVMGIEGAARGWSWNGRAVGSPDFGLGVYTTSSFETDKVESYRRARFLEMQEKCAAAKDWRWDFQTDVSYPQSAYNPLMERPDSMTHSLTEIEVRGGSLRCGYCERVAGEPRFGERVDLSLAIDAAETKGE